MLSATQLMTHVTSLHQQGKLHAHEHTTAALVVGRWLGGSPLTLRELDDYLPVGERQRRKYLARLVQQSILRLEQRPDRLWHIVPVCHQQVAPSMSTTPTNVKQVDPEPAPPKATPKHVPIQPTDTWLQWLPADKRAQVHAVSADKVTRVRRALKKVSPSDLEPGLAKKIREVRYPFGYLATVLTADGDLQKHARRKDTPPLKAETVRAPSHPRPPLPEPEPPVELTPEQQEEVRCTFQDMMKMLDEPESKRTRRSSRTHSKPNAPSGPVSSSTLSLTPDWLRG